MPLYKYPDYRDKSQDAAFDQLISPNTPTPWAGIYRCDVVDREITMTQGQTLPCQNHHYHKPGRKPIQWRLVISQKGTGDL